MAIELTPEPAVWKVVLSRRRRPQADVDALMGMQVVLVNTGTRGLPGAGSLLVADQPLSYGRVWWCLLSADHLDPNTCLEAHELLEAAAAR